MTTADWRAALFSVKAALAALTALWITLWVGLSMPFWAITTAYIVSHPLSGATRSKAIYRVMGTLVGAAVAVAIVPALVDWPILLCLALALWVGGTLFVSLLDRSPRAYAMMLAGYTAALISFPAVDRPEAVFDIAVARVTEIGIGITCATVAHSLLWPQSVAQSLGERFKLWLQDARDWRRHILDEDADAVMVSDGDAVAKIPAGRRRLAQDAMDCVILATHVPFDTSHWRDASASVQALLRRMLLLLPTLSGLADRHEALAVAQARDDASPDWRQLLAQSHAVRRQQTGRLLAECDTILAHLEDHHVPAPVLAKERHRAIALHADWRLALISAISATLSILICCAIWIQTGWADGGVAAMMSGVFCCLFAALDNPAPMILRFGATLLAALPLAGFYLFVLLPPVDGFIGLALLLLPVLLVAGWVNAHPQWGVLGTAAILGFANALALQESFHANLARFINANSGQAVGVLVAVIVTASLRTAGVDRIIARIRLQLRADMVVAASATAPVSRIAVLGRTTDRLAFIAQRLGDADEDAAATLRDVRIAMNIVTIQHLRTQVDRPLDLALARVLRDVARGFRGEGDAMPARLLARIDTALRIMVAQPERWARLSGEILGDDPAEGLAALVAMRRNLFPQAPDFQRGLAA